MWEHLGKILVSENAVLILIFVGFVVFLVINMVRSGDLRLNVRGVKIGKDEVERAIIRNQIEYAHNCLVAFERGFDKPANYNEYKGKYIFELVFDEVVKWIVFNHIEASQTYISIKVANIKNVILSHTDNEYFKNDDFDVRLYAYFDKLIRHLVEIRKTQKT